jgi:hypothetical protein
VEIPVVDLDVVEVAEVVVLVGVIENVCAESGR